MGEDFGDRDSMIRVGDEDLQEQITERGREDVVFSKLVSDRKGMGGRVCVGDLRTD